MQLSMAGPQNLRVVVVVVVVVVVLTYRTASDWIRVFASISIEETAVKDDRCRPMRWPLSDRYRPPPLVRFATLFADQKRTQSDRLSLANTARRTRKEADERNGRANLNEGKPIKEQSITFSLWMNFFFGKEKKV